MIHRLACRQIRANDQPRSAGSIYNPVDWDLLDVAAAPREVLEGLVGMISIGRTGTAVLRLGDVQYLVQTFEFNPDDPETLEEQARKSLVSYSECSSKWA